MYVVVLPKMFNLKLIKNKTQNQVVEHSIRLLTGLTPHNVRVIKDQKTKRKEKKRKEKERKDRGVCSSLKETKETQQPNAMCGPWLVTGLGEQKVIKVHF